MLFSISSQGDLRCFAALSHAAVEDVIYDGCRIPKGEPIDALVGD